jgi:hypothetical protein
VSTFIGILVVTAFAVGIPTLVFALAWRASENADKLLKRFGISENEFKSKPKFWRQAYANALSVEAYDAARILDNRSLQKCDRNAFLDECPKGLTVTVTFSELRADLNTIVAWTNENTTAHDWRMVKDYDGSDYSWSESFRIRFYFANAEDAALFKLKWA